jgi:hypothetical protein
MFVVTSFSKVPVLLGRANIETYELEDDFFDLLLEAFSDQTHRLLIEVVSAFPSILHSKMQPISAKVEFCALKIFQSKKKRKLICRPARSG